MPLVPKIDPNKIFASNAPTQDKPAAFDNYEKGMDETRKNLGRPTIPQLNYLHQTADQKILWIHQNGGGLPYDASIEYAENAVTLKDGELKQIVGGVWVETKTKALPATAITTVSSQNQQQINDFGGAKWYAKVGGYELGSTVKLANGEIVKSTALANTVNPNVDMTGWMFNFPFVNVKTYGAVGDGITDDTLAIMSACAAFSTGTLLFPAGRYIINYDTLNPFFSSRVGNLVGASKCRSPVFFGLKNAVIYGYGAEIFVKNQAKTNVEYDATFGIFMNVGGCEDFYCLGLSFNGNAFNQPVPSATFNTLYIPRNHGFTFFNKDSGVYKNIHFYDNTFKELGWHDTRNLSSGDNAGDGVLFFGIKDLQNLYIERNNFLDIGRWAVAVDILTDHLGMYKNININKNIKISEKNLQMGYANVTRELGFYDHEVACGFDTVNVCDNILINGRPAIRIGGSERQNSTTENIRCTISRNTVRVGHEHKWYMFAVSNQRNYKDMTISNNDIQIKTQSFPFFVGDNTSFYDSSFNKNTITVGALTGSSIGSFPILMPNGGQRGNFSCSGNIFNGIGLVASDPSDLTEPLSISISANDFYNCQPLQASLNNPNISLYFISNTFHLSAKYNGIQCNVGADGKSPLVVLDNQDYREVISTEPERLSGKVIVKNAVNFVPKYMQPVSGSYTGYYLAGSILLNYPTPQNKFRNLFCTSDGICLNTMRGDKAWASNEIIASVSGYYGPVYRTNNNNVYQARTTGTTGATIPVHTVGDISDGGVTWRYIGKVAQFSQGGFMSTQGTITYDPPSLAASGAAGDSVTTTVTLAGAVIGDNVSVSFSQYNAAIEISAQVSAANIVTVKFKNTSTAAVDMLSGTLKVKNI